LTESSCSVKSRVPNLVAARSRGRVSGRSLAGTSGSNPSDGMNVYCECSVLSGRGLCVGPITRPEKSYRMVCITECHREASTLRGPWATRGFCHRGAKIHATRCDGAAAQVCHCSMPGTTGQYRLYSQQRLRCKSRLDAHLVMTSQYCVLNRTNFQFAQFRTR